MKKTQAFIFSCSLVPILLAFFFTNVGHVSAAVTSSADTVATSSTTAQPFTITSTTPTGIKTVTASTSIGNSFSTTTSGTLNYTLNTPPSSKATVKAEKGPVNFHLRHQDRIIYQADIEMSNVTYFDSCNNIDYHLSGTSTVFSTLVKADQKSSAFKITNAQYDALLNAFHVSCVDVASSSGEGGHESACNNWNYTVDGEYPSISMDKYELSGGESVYVFFSTPWKVTANTSTAAVGEPVRFTTWRYDYANTRDPWATDGGNSIEISVPNPNPSGWWDEIIATSTIITDTNGQVEYAFSTSGTYYAKITAPDWSKWSETIAIDILDRFHEPASQSASSSQDTINSAVSEQKQTDLVPEETIQQAVDGIIEFLRSKQSEDGGIIDGGISDWAAISFAATDIDPAEVRGDGDSLAEYIDNYEFNHDTELNLCASYPRHILALSAADRTIQDQNIQSLYGSMINQCVKSGKQYGEPGIGDDVFALLALSMSPDGYADLINNLLDNIVRDQSTTGAFTWNGYPDADITGAAINAFARSRQAGFTFDERIIDKAKNYLKSTQLPDGGWGFGQSSALTTSWAVMGINSINETQSEWIHSEGKNPWHVLVENINEDGYYESSRSESEIDWFSTKHAIPAMLGHGWPITISKSRSHNSDESGNDTSNRENVENSYLESKTDNETDQQNETDLDQKNSEDTAESPTEKQQNPKAGKKDDSRQDDEKQTTDKEEKKDNEQENVFNSPPDNSTVEKEFTGLEKFGIKGQVLSDPVQTGDDNPEILKQPESATGGTRLLANQMSAKSSEHAGYFGRMIDFWLKNSEIIFITDGILLILLSIYFYYKKT